MSVQFRLEGQPFMALNAGPQFKFTEAISFFVGCETQQEIDELWAKLIAGGGPSQCGWLKDKFGLSWQIIPTTLGRMLSDKDAAKSGRVMNAMLQMEKIDLKQLQQAYEELGAHSARASYACRRFVFPRFFGLDVTRFGLALAASTSDSSYASRSQSVMGASTSSRCLIWRKCTILVFEARSTRRT
jgi:hypothetical protein